MKDKLCLITGVGPGTGKALVKKFASQGYSVIMVARDADRLASIKKEVPNTFAYPCDVSDEAAVNDMASQVVEEIGEPQSDIVKQYDSPGSGKIVGIILPVAT